MLEKVRKMSTSRKRKKWTLKAKKASNGIKVKKISPNRGNMGILRRPIGTEVAGHV